MPNINKRPRNKRPHDKNGKKHGEWVEYHNNGQVFYRANYFHGIHHGSYEYYRPDGTLSYLVNYNMGIEIGYSYDNYYKQKKYYLCLI